MDWGCIVIKHHFQKTFTNQYSYAQHKRQNNYGMMPQYYVENTHEAIVTKDTFMRAKALLTRRRYRRTEGEGASSYTLSTKIKCSECNSYFIRKQRKSGNTSWSCIKHDKANAMCSTPPILESTIEHAFITLYRIIKASMKDILHPMLYQLEQLQSGAISGSVAINELNQSVVDLSEQRHMLTRLLSKGFMEPDVCQAQLNSISQRLADINRKRRSLINAQAEDNAIEKTQLLIDILDDAPPNLASLEDSEVFDMIVDKVIIDKDKNITFRLINGLELGGTVNG